MKLKKSDVEHIAKLAKLCLTGVEIEKFANQLSLVLNYVDQLKEVDTSEVLPTSQTTGLVNVVRDDKGGPCQSLLQKQALSGARKTKNGYFVVSKKETIGV